MRGKDQQPWAVHVDEGHHNHLIGRKLSLLPVKHQVCRGALPRNAGGRSRSLSPFVAVIQRGFVAMMSIGDQEFLVPHFPADELDQRGVGNFPDSVEDAILIFNIDIGGSTAGQQAVDFARVAVQHEELPEMRPCNPQ